MSRLRHAVAWRAERARGQVAAARVAGERRLGSLWPPGPPGPPTSRILCYHSVGTPHWGTNDVTPARFAGHLERLLDAGCRIVPASELAAGDVPDGPRVALTFDDGARSLLDQVAPVLRDLGVPWTAFVVTGWADGGHRYGHDLVLDWHEIEALAAAGATIASHSVDHPNFAGLAEGEVGEQLVASRAAIRARLGIDTREFAIPVGRARDWPAGAQRAARDAGYDTVYAATEDRRPPGTVPRTFITRFDDPRVFRTALAGGFDRWEEWL
ncbi:polysaccharide deacetylase family protein [Actinomycetospora aeridis]|uniref:Polysaccharide deacetylase family protein n=1 Tax=Actinomycetospora aeridis TaxID=3129231 RepID=A0ABU8N8N1_9PSEU